MGTPDFSVPTLTALAAQGHEVVACYTQPPRPAGRRGLELTKSPVHRQAEAMGIPVRTPKSLKSEEEQALFRALDADASVVGEVTAIATEYAESVKRLKERNKARKLLNKIQRGGLVANDDVKATEAWLRETFAGDRRGRPLVISATEIDGEDARIAEIAHTLGVPVNVPDRPALCTAVLPAIVDRGEVTVAVGTSAAAPVLAQRLRAWLENELHPRLGDLAGFLGGARHRSRLLDRARSGDLLGPGRRALRGLAHHHRLAVQTRFHSKDRHRHLAQSPAHRLPKISFHPRRSKARW